MFDLQPMVVVQNNQDLIVLWLHGKSKNTCDGYYRDIKYFLAFLEHKSLQTITFNDVQAFANAQSPKGTPLPPSDVDCVPLNP